MTNQEVQRRAQYVNKALQQGVNRQTKEGLNTEQVHTLRGRTNDSKGVEIKQRKNINKRKSPTGQRGGILARESTVRLQETPSFCGPRPNYCNNKATKDF